jgi:hypothetical protein
MTRLATGRHAYHFCGDLLHHLDLEVAFRHQLLWPHVLLFELLQAPDVVRLERSISRKIRTICSSVNCDFFIPCLLSEASLSTDEWPENPEARHCLLRELD